MVYMANLVLVYTTVVCKESLSFQFSESKKKKEIGEREGCFFNVL